MQKQTEQQAQLGPEPLSTVPLLQGHHGSLALTALFRQILHVWLESPAPIPSLWCCRWTAQKTKRQVTFTDLSRLFLLPRPSVSERKDDIGCAKQAAPGCRAHSAQMDSSSLAVRGVGGEN